VYALSFIEGFKDIFNNDYERYKFTYQNAIRTMDILSKDIEMHYTSETDKRTSFLTIILTVFTIFIGFITLIIAIDASFGIVEYLVNFGTLDESYKSIWSVLIILFIFILFSFILIRHANNIIRKF